MQSLLPTFVLRSDYKPIKLDRRACTTDNHTEFDWKVEFFQTQIIVGGTAVAIKMQEEGPDSSLEVVVKHKQEAGFAWPALAFHFSSYGSKSQSCQDRNH